MKISTNVIALSFAFIISGSAYASADEAIASAEKARKAAAEVGYEWRDTAKMIKQAKELVAKGQTENAMELARKAEEQGKDALAQYHVEYKRYASTH